MRFVTVNDPCDEAFRDLAYVWLRNGWIWWIDDLRELTPDADFSIIEPGGRSITFKCLDSISPRQFPVEVSRRCSWADLQGWLHTTSADKIAFVSQSHITIAATEALRAADQELLARWAEGAELSLSEEARTDGEVTSVIRTIPAHLVPGLELYVRE